MSDCGVMGKTNQHPRGFMSRLARSQKGNVVAIVAAAIIPLAALIGGGLDMGRAYMARARMQQACDAAAIRKALKASGHEGTYAVPATCDLVYNCDELKEALLRRGTPEVQKMFRPAAELRLRNISDAGDDGSPDDSCLRWCARAFDKYPGQREEDIIRACDACRKA